MKQTKDLILKDLKNFNYTEIDYINLSEEDLQIFYKNHIKNNYEEVNIQDIFDDPNKVYYIDTPDGPQLLGDFFIKEKREITEITTGDKKISRSSSIHRYETIDGWKHAKDINKNDKILSRNSGYLNVLNVKETIKEDVYDFEVLHENHRYWGNDLSSHNCGKTYLMLNMAREAQYVGYDVLWLDSEAAVDKTTFEKFGLDISKIYYQPAQTIKQVAGIVANMCKAIKEKKKKGFEVPKLFVALDSLGNLSSGKEREDILAGNDKRDMTKQQELGGMFRVITTDIAGVDGMIVISNHVYSSIGGYIPTVNIKGGTAGIYNCSIITVLSKANLKSDKKTDGKESEEEVTKIGLQNKTGLILTSKIYKNRFAKPIPIKFHLSFFKGMNPFVGLENYISWEACGIQRGTYEEEILEKPALDEKGNQIIYRNKPKVEKINTGNWIFKADDEAKGWAVKHLNRVVLPHEFFTKEVFTDEVLKQLDENVIKPLFRFNEFNDEEEIISGLGLDDYDDNNIMDSTEIPTIGGLNLENI